MVKRETASRFFGHILAFGSTPVLCAIGLPPALALAWSVFSPAVQWQAVLLSASFKTFGLLIAVSGVLGILGGIALRRWHRAAAAASALTLVAWGWYVGQTHFSGTMSLGAGETSGQFVNVAAGPSARTPHVDLQVKAVNGGSAPSCMVLVGGKSSEIVIGKPVSAGGVRVSLLDVHPAPLFYIEDGGGGRVVEGYLKLGEGGGVRDYFQFGVMPHRFYLTPAEPSPPGSLKGFQIPLKKLHLLVTRGKLTLLNSDVSAGEKVPIDGLSAGFEPGEGWVRLRVTSAVPFWPLLAAGGGAALAALLGFIRRGRL